MTTGKEKANFALKALVGYEDFKGRFLDYLGEKFAQLGGRIYSNGVFDALHTLTYDAGTVEIGVDSHCTDGAGNFMRVDPAGGRVDIGQGAGPYPFANVGATPYYVALEYASIPEGIRINPRSAMPGYEFLTDAIGHAMTIDSVTVDGLALDFALSGLTADQDGRTVVIYKKQPARQAITEAIAIKRVVIAGGVATTADHLGQETPSTVTDDYVAVLLGPTVDSAVPSGPHVLLGTITSGVVDTTSQQLIDQTLSTIMVYPGGPAWADGVTNPASTVLAQLTKIITDLAGSQGSAKLGSPASGNLSAGTLLSQLQSLDTNKARVNGSNTFTGSQTFANSMWVQGTFQADGAADFNGFTYFNENATMLGTARLSYNGRRRTVTIPLETFKPQDTSGGVPGWYYDPTAIPARWRSRDNGLRLIVPIRFPYACTIVRAELMGSAGAVRNQGVSGAVDFRAQFQKLEHDWVTPALDTTGSGPATFANFDDEPNLEAIDLEGTLGGNIGTYTPGDIWMIKIWAGIEASSGAHVSDSLYQVRCVVDVNEIVETD